MLRALYDKMANIGSRERWGYTSLVKILVQSTLIVYLSAIYIFL